MNPAFETVVRRHLTWLDAGEPLPTERPLKDLGLDSMRAVDLVFDLEDELGVVLPDEAMTANTFATAGSLWAAVTEASEPLSAGTVR
ncbi:MAG TPA: acyl carrier protein [Pseudonocardiaceae bacterium]|nr:acyl carrier protein [Pseudonocardiaceae bacterium]